MRETIDKIHCWETMTCQTCNFLFQGLQALSTQQGSHAKDITHGYETDTSLCVQVYGYIFI